MFVDVFLYIYKLYITTYFLFFIFLLGVWTAKTLKVGKEIKTITFATPTVTSKTEQDSVKYQWQDNELNV